MCPKSYKEDDQLSKENLRLKSAVEELSILNDMATAIASTQSLDQITNLIVKKCVKHLKSEQGSIQLIDEKDFVNPFHTMIRIRDNIDDKDSLRFDKQISDIMLANKKPLLINEFKREEKIALRENSFLKIRSLLSVPMIIKGKMIGILSLFNKESDDGFNETDQRLLQIIAAQSANVIENSRLFEEEKKLILIQQEIQVASEIQKNLLPLKMPDINGYDIYAINIPAREVGGDYYDFIKVSENKTAIALGDVSGKGLPASMLMANLQATLRGQLLFCNCAKDCIKRANNLLHKSTDISKFVTLFFGILDTEKNILTYCNAGHNVPVFLAKGNKFKLDKGGMLLSCIEDTNYDEEAISFEKGSTLVVFSDGITEAMNEAEEEYGEERLYDLIENKLSLSSKLLAEEILGDVKIFTSGIPQMDDITLLIIKRYE
ncbi:MAG: PP2C family protein-serine/threonine phosphatase [Ignavibacteriaceae bacterium]|nr:PP2C family protein-serine/threonine phosphatase [Ignavibacteriaceae bacterium]